MDDGWEMTDGVQPKVPIRGQPEGGVSPTGANGRRLGETANVAAAQPRLAKPGHAGAALKHCFVFSFQTRITGRSRFPASRKQTHACFL